jgi:hypothetical protein
VLEDGRTVEEGTHEELVARPDGLYRTLSQLQFTDNGKAEPALTEEDQWPAPPPTDPLPRPRP